MFVVYSMNKSGVRREMLITRENVDLAAVQQLLIPFSSTFLGMRFLFD